jgi:hypothetical protein
MLRHRRLGDTEFVLDDRCDGARCVLAFGQQLQNPPSHRIAQNIESVHRVIITAPTYISQT